MVLNYEVNEMHRDFDQMPNRYVVKFSIPTLVLLNILDLFDIPEAETGIYVLFYVSKLIIINFSMRNSML